MLVPPDGASDDTLELIWREIERIFLRPVRAFNQDGAVISRIRFVRYLDGYFLLSRRVQGNFRMTSKRLPEFQGVNMKGDLPAADHHLCQDIPDFRIIQRQRIALEPGNGGLIIRKQILQIIAFREPAVPSDLWDDLCITAGSD